MKRLLRAPLAWLVTAEIVVVAALLAATWHFVEAHHLAAQSPLPGVVRARQPGGPGPGVSPPPSAPAPGTPGAPTSIGAHAAGPTPGLATDGSFWRGQLADVNREQSSWQRAQWAFIQSAITAARTYIERVVVPGIERAERAGAAGNGQPPAPRSP